ncbi:MAG TPA: response regulator [Fibrobacteria bacterium]|nr:response regulator [Fibrobacteria bacterium]
MNSSHLLTILRDAFAQLAAENPSFSPLPDVLDDRTTLDALHVTDANIGEVARELRTRLGGIAINVELMYLMHKAVQGRSMDIGSYRTLGDLARHIQATLHHGRSNPVVVYVDDEEENLFVFRRRFGKRLNLRTFSDPREALAFIEENPDVVLVLTDESMPGMTGNQLCDRAREKKPALKFILITGNPAGDKDLMHRSLRHGRFYDFISKPLDFEQYGEEYMRTLTRVLSGETV